MKTYKRLKVGDIIKVGQYAYLVGKKRDNSYAEMFGFVFKCGVSCKNKCGQIVQFLGIGNNEKASHFDLSRCEIIRPNEYYF